MVVMPDTVIHGSPLDPVEEFRSHPLPTFERRGDFQDIIYEVAEGIARITIKFVDKSKNWYATQFTDFIKF